MPVATKIEVEVDVYAHVEDGDVLFSHAWKEQGAPKRKKGRIEIPPGQTDTPIHFQLHDHTGLKLAFVTAAEQAMWVDLTDCPTCVGNGGQIKYPTPPSKHHLRVTDDNVNPPCILHFALQFTGNSTASDGPPYFYDPEIKNV